MKKTTPRPKARPAAKAAGELNAAQHQAVRHGRSPLLIIAGAGTGKTLTLAHRVARLIEDGVLARTHSAAYLHPPGRRGDAPPRRDPPRQ